MENQQKTVVGQKDQTELSDTLADSNSPHQSPESKSLLAKIKNWGATKYLGLTLLATSPAAMTSCDDGTVEPKQIIETKLSAADIEFAGIFDVNNPKMAKLLEPSILDGKPVVSIPVSPVPNNKAFTEAFQNFMDIELRLVDAKARTYSITPIINKSSVEAIITKAIELDPGKEEYGITLINQALDKAGVVRNLSNGFSVANRDDNNPATLAPSVTQLPTRFTLDEFAKFYTDPTLQKSYTINEGDSYSLGTNIATVGNLFDSLKYPVNPSIEAVSISNKTGN